VERPVERKKNGGGDMKRDERNKDMPRLS